MTMFVHGDKLIISKGKYRGRSATYYRLCGKSSCIVKLDPHGPVVTIRKTSLPAHCPQPPVPMTRPTMTKVKKPQPSLKNAPADLRTLRQVRDELDLIIKAFENASLD